MLLLSRLAVGLLIASSALLAQSCGGPQTVARLSLNDLETNEGFVVFRLLNSEMARDPGVIWARDFRLHYRPLSAGPLDASTSSLKLRGRYVAVEAGGGPQLHVLKLSGGQYTFSAVVASLQEEPIDIRFEVMNGQVTYIGDLQIDIVTRLGEVAGASRIDRLGAAVRWAPEEVRAELARRYPDGVPALRLRQAAVMAR